MVILLGSLLLTLQCFGNVPVLIDTDPALGYQIDGHPRDVDDGLALIEALNHAHLEVRGVTTVFGNAPVRVGTAITKRILTMKRSSIPFAEGASSPKAFSEAATAFLATKLREKPHTVVALGPLTNIAHLITTQSSASKNIQNIVAVMGRRPGHHFYIGEKGPLRDFNFAMDPEAAKTVLDSDIPITLTPFELSVTIALNRKLIDGLNKKKSPVSQFLAQQVQPWLDFWKKAFPEDRGFHPWDSATIGYVTHPEFFDCDTRGFRIRNTHDKAHGLSNAKTGKSSAEKPWLELSKRFPGKKITYCHQFKKGMKDKFTEELVAHLY